MSIQGIGLVNPILQFVDASGVPYAGGTVTFLQSGTQNLQNVFSDVALSTPLTNPVSLNAAGRSSTSASGPDTPVYFSPLAYDFTLKDSSGNTIYGPVTWPGSQWPGVIQTIATLSPAANANGYLNRITSTINRAGSGTHALFAAMRYDAPTIGAGAATLTEASTIYVAGPPSAGSTVYSFHVAAGNVQFDGNLGVAGTLTGFSDLYSTTWTDYTATSTITGWASFTAGQKFIFYKIVGKTVFVHFNIAGVSNATTVSFTLPVAMFVGSGVQPYIAIACYGQDNGADMVNPAFVKMNAGSATVNIFKDFTSAVWTNANGKVVAGQFWYQTA